MRDVSRNIFHRFVHIQNFLKLVLQRQERASPPGEGHIVTRDSSSRVLQPCATHSAPQASGEHFPNP
jgi:hypothetical protein